MPKRGSLVVVLLLIAGLTAAAVAVWHHRQMTRRALELWGSEGAQLIERARDVTLFRLEPLGRDASAGSRETVRVANREYVFAAQCDMTSAAGFSHVRWGLCQDSSYAWNQHRDACDGAEWDYAVRFVDGDRRLTIVLDTHSALVTLAGSDRCESISPIADEVAAVLTWQLPASKSP